MNEIQAKPLEGHVLDNVCDDAEMADPFTGRPRCYGELTTGYDPYAEEIHGEKIVVTLCEYHLQQHFDDI